MSRFGGGVGRISGDLGGMGSLLFFEGVAEIELSFRTQRERAAS